MPSSASRCGSNCRACSPTRATVVYVTQDYREAMALGDRIAVLEGGRIAQIGRPGEIYLTPASMRIARLFGDPPINLLDVVPERDGNGIFARLSDQRVALDPELAEAVDRPCTLGIRPEAIAFSDAPDAIPVTVEAETPLNEKTVTLAVTKRGREVMISRPHDAPGPAEGEAGIAIDAADAVLFDRETGARIVPGAGRDSAEEAA